MKRLKSTILALLTVLVGHSAAQGQSEMDRLSDKIKSVVEAAEPGWKCKRGTPFGSGGLQEVCSLYTDFKRPNMPLERVPMKHVAIHADLCSSAQAAERAFHLGTMNDSQALQDLGDEAYGFGMDHPNIAVRKGRYIFWIRSVAYAKYDPEGQKSR
jgi:hypothetical protein